MSAAGPAILVQRKQCAWCHCLIQAGHEPTTHGICPECLAAERAKAAARRAERGCGGAS